MEYQISEAGIKTNKFSIKKCSKGLEFSIEALVEEMKLIVTERHEFECRDVSKRIFLFLGTS